MLIEISAKVPSIKGRTLSVSYGDPSMDYVFNKIEEKEISKLDLTYSMECREVLTGVVEEFDQYISKLEDVWRENIEVIIELTQIQIEEYDEYYEEEYYEEIVADPSIIRILNKHFSGDVEKISGGFRINRRINPYFLSSIIYMMRDVLQEKFLEEKLSAYEVIEESIERFRNIADFLTTYNFFKELMGYKIPGDYEYIVKSGPYNLEYSYISSNLKTLYIFLGIFQEQLKKWFLNIVSFGNFSSNPTYHLLLTIYLSVLDSDSMEDYYNFDLAESKLRGLK